MVGVTLKKTLRSRMRGFRIFILFVVLFMPTLARSLSNAPLPRCDTYNSAHSLPETLYVARVEKRSFTHRVARDLSVMPIRNTRSTFGPFGVVELTSRHPDAGLINAVNSGDEKPRKMTPNRWNAYSREPYIDWLKEPQESAPIGFTKIFPMRFYHGSLHGPSDEHFSFLDDIARLPEAWAEGTGELTYRIIEVIQGDQSLEGTTLTQGFSFNVALEPDSLPPPRFGEVFISDGTTNFSWCHPAYRSLSVGSYIQFRDAIDALWVDFTWRRFELLHSYHTWTRRGGLHLYANREHITLPSDSVGSSGVSEIRRRVEIERILKHDDVSLRRVRFQNGECNRVDSTGCLRSFSDSFLPEGNARVSFFQLMFLGLMITAPVGLYRSRRTLLKYRSVGAENPNSKANEEST